MPHADRDVAERRTVALPGVAWWRFLIADGFAVVVRNDYIQSVRRRFSTERHCWCSFASTAVMSCRAHNPTKCYTLSRKAADKANTLNEKPVK